MNQDKNCDKVEMESNKNCSLNENESESKSQKMVRRSSWPLETFKMFDDEEDNLEEGEKENKIGEKIEYEEEPNGNKDIKVGEIDMNGIKRILECMMKDEPCECILKCVSNHPKKHSLSFSSPKTQVHLPSSSAITRQPFLSKSSRLRHTRSRSYLPILESTHYCESNPNYSSKRAKMNHESPPTCLPTCPPQQKVGNPKVPIARCESYENSGTCSSSSSFHDLEMSDRVSEIMHDSNVFTSSASFKIGDSISLEMEETSSGEMMAHSSNTVIEHGHDNEHGALSSSTSTNTFEMVFPDEYILRELAEMRSLLERILENGDNLTQDWNRNQTDEILNLLGISLPESTLEPREPTPHFPIGAWEFEECGICLELGWLYRRACCSYCSCLSCLRKYYSTQIELANITIECINPACHSYVHRDEISARLDNNMKEVYYRLLIANNLSDRFKTCPQCNSFHKLTDDEIKKMQSKHHSNSDPLRHQVICTQCQFLWCFKCHAPWHTLMTCKQFRKGDRLLKTWAKQTIQGQTNAQKCPRCKVFIQKTTGCDHMHCIRCKTDFCYKCGDKLRRLKFFGDHYSKLSIFGCKYRYKADKPFQRKLIRGTVFGSKLLVCPIVGSVALVAGAVVVALGILALPLYGGIKLFRKYQEKNQIKSSRKDPNRNVRHIYVDTIADTVADTQENNINVNAIVNLNVNGNNNNATTNNQVFGILF